jgi:hypothetical protein
MELYGTMRKEDRLRRKGRVNGDTLGRMKQASLDTIETAGRPT